MNDTRKVERVIDGDTLQIAGEDTTTRVAFIDTPESVHRDKSRNVAAGEEATKLTSYVLPTGADVTTADFERDKYNRKVASVRRNIQGVDIDMGLVALDQGMSHYQNKFGQPRDPQMHSLYAPYFSHYASAEYLDSQEPMAPERKAAMTELHEKFKVAYANLQEGKGSQEEFDTALVNLYRDPAAVVQFRNELAGFRHDPNQAPDGSLKTGHNFWLQFPDLRERYNAAMRNNHLRIRDPKQQPGFWENVLAPFSAYSAVTNLTDILNLKAAREVGRDEDVNVNALLDGAPQFLHAQILDEAANNNAASAMELKRQLLQDAQNQAVMNDQSLMAGIGYGLAASLLDPAALMVGFGVGGAATKGAMVATRPWAGSLAGKVSAGVMNWAAGGAAGTASFAAPRLAGDHLYTERDFALEVAVGTGISIGIGGAVTGGLHGLKARAAKREARFADSAGAFLDRTDNLRTPPTDGTPPSGGEAPSFGIAPSREEALRAAGLTPGAAPVGSPVPPPQTRRGGLAAAISEHAKARDTLRDDILARAQGTATSLERAPEVQAIREAAEAASRDADAVNRVAAALPEAERPPAGFDDITEVSPEGYNAALRILGKNFAEDSILGRMMRRVKTLNRDQGNEEEVGAYLRQLNAQILKVVAAYPDGNVPPEVANGLQHALYGEAGRTANVFMELKGGGSPEGKARMLESYIRHLEQQGTGGELVPMTTDELTTKYGYLLTNDEGLADTIGDDIIMSYSRQRSPATSMLQDILEIQEGMKDSPELSHLIGKLNAAFDRAMSATSEGPVSFQGPGVVQERVPVTRAEARDILLRDGLEEGTPEWRAGMSRLRERGIVRRLTDEPDATPPLSQEEALVASHADEGLQAAILGGEGNRPFALPKRRFDKRVPVTPPEAAKMLRAQGLTPGSDGWKRGMAYLRERGRKVSDDVQDVGEQKTQNIGETVVLTENLDELTPAQQQDRLDRLRERGAEDALRKAEDAGRAVEQLRKELDRAQRNGGDVDKIEQQLLKAEDRALEARKNAWAWDAEASTESWKARNKGISRAQSRADVTDDVEQFLVDANTRAIEGKTVTAVSDILDDDVLPRSFIYKRNPGRIPKSGKDGRATAEQVSDTTERLKRWVTETGTVKAARAERRTAATRLEERTQRAKAALRKDKFATVRAAAKQGGWENAEAILTANRRIADEIAARQAAKKAAQQAADAPAAASASAEEVPVRLTPEDLDNAIRNAPIEEAPPAGDGPPVPPQDPPAGSPPPPEEPPAGPRREQTPEEAIAAAVARQDEERMDVQNGILRDFILSGERDAFRAAEAGSTGLAGVTGAIGNFLGKLTESLTQKFLRSDMVTANFIGARILENPAGFGGNLRRGGTASTLKALERGQMLSRFAGQYHRLIDEFAAEQGLNVLQRMKAREQAGLHNDTVELFNREFIRAQDLVRQGKPLPENLSPAIRRFMQHWDDFTHYAFDRAQEVGVNGFVGKQKINGYVTRSWPRGTMKRALDKFGRDRVKGRLAQAMLSDPSNQLPDMAAALERADSHIDWVLRGDAGTDMGMASLADARGKSRMHIDVTGGPDQHGLDILDLIDTNVREIGQRYSERMSGWIALADATDGMITGPRDMQLLKNHLLDEAGSTRHNAGDRKTWEQWFDDVENMMLGRPLRGGLAQELRDFKTLTSLTRMGKLGFAQAIEGGHQAQRVLAHLAEDPAFVNKVFELAKSSPDDVPLLKEIVSISGITDDLPLFNRTSVLDDIADLEEVSKMRQVSLWLADKATFGEMKNVAGHQLGQLSGYNAVRRYQSRLVQSFFIMDAAKHFRNGTGKMTNARRADVGLTEIDGTNPLLEHHFRNVASWDADGNLVALNADQWSPEARKELAIAMTRDEAQMIQHTLPGEAPPWFNRPMMALIMQFREMPIVAQQKSLNRQLKFADSEAVLGTAMNIAMAGLVRWSLRAALLAGGGMVAGRGMEALEELPDPLDKNVQWSKYVTQFGIMADAYDWVTAGMDISSKDSMEERGEALLAEVGKQVPVLGLLSDYADAAVGDKDDSRLEGIQGITPLGNTVYGELIVDWLSRFTSEGQ